MCELGYAEQVASPYGPGTLDAFRVTPNGAKQALRRGERLREEELLGSRLQRSIARLVQRID